jgi:hypothetical protein
MSAQRLSESTVAVAAINKTPHILNPFQSRDAIWHHTFNSVLHMLQFWGAGES